MEAMGPEVMERARNMGPAEAARFLEAARAAAGNPGEAGGGGGGGGGRRRAGEPAGGVHTHDVRAGSG